MLVANFDPAQHLPMISGWIRARGLGDDCGDPSLLPRVGFIVNGIVAGFLFQTDSKLAYVGSVISDPASPADARGAALTALLVRLCTKAAELGYVAVAGLPTVPSLTARFAELGFVTVPGDYAIRRV